MRFTIKNARDILQNYSFGEFKEIKRLTSGYANQNYSVKTSKGICLLRICKEKSVNEINYELKVMQELKKIKFPTAYPIMKVDKTYINKTKFGSIVLYDFAKGEEPKPNEKNVKEIAKAVAKLNSIKNWKKLSRKNAISLDLCKLIIKKFKQSKNKYPEIFDFFIEETNFLSKPLREKIPKGLVHGDVFTDNTKFKDNKFVAILDFEEVCTDNLLFDVGVTINGFCFNGTQLNHNLVEVFLKEYNKIRKITPKEKKLIYAYVRWGAQAMICWHLKHLLNKREARKLARVKSHMNRIKNIRKLEPDFFSKLI